MPAASFSKCTGCGNPRPCKCAQIVPRNKSVPLVIHIERGLTSLMSFQNNALGVRASMSSNAPGSTMAGLSGANANGSMGIGGIGGTGASASSSGGPSGGASGGPSGGGAGGPS